jgi:two-component system, LytTR family, response regulator
MKTLIIDDESSARSRLTRLLAVHPHVEIVGEAEDGLDAVRQIERVRPDLVFLDIEMPGLGGFDVLRALDETAPLPLVIFVTGYDQHALAAFEANALAYLLKPVEAERLAQAVARAAKLSALDDERARQQERVLRASRESPCVLRQIVCRKRDGLVLVPPDQIFWFEVKDGLVRARTATETFWVNYQLVELEASLPPDLFFRARREVLVNLAKVRQIKPYFKRGFLLVMNDGANTEIAVSERQVPPLRQRLPGL